MGPSKGFLTTVDSSKPCVGVRDTGVAARGQVELGQWRSGFFLVGLHVLTKEVSRSYGRTPGQDGGTGTSRVFVFRSHGGTLWKSDVVPLSQVVDYSSFREVAGEPLFPHLPLKVGMSRLLLADFVCEHWVHWVCGRVPKTSDLPCEVRGCETVKGNHQFCYIRCNV